MKEQTLSKLPTPRLYQVASYHYKSCQHYAEERDMDKMLLHSMAAEKVISSNLDEEEFKEYRNFCIRNKITHYNYLKL